MADNPASPPEHQPPEHQLSPPRRADEQADTLPPGSGQRWVAPPPPPPAPSTYGEMRAAGAEPTVTLGDYEPASVSGGSTGEWPAASPPGAAGYQARDGRLRTFVTASGLPRKERSLRWMTLAAAVAVLAVAAALATTQGASVLHTHSTAGPAHTGPTGRGSTGGAVASNPSGSTAPPSNATGPSNTGGPPASSSTTNTTNPPSNSTTSAAAANGKPAVAAITPDTGAAGQTVKLSGSGFFSSNGRITVMFGHTQAGVNCPSQTSCVVTVPAASSASPSAPVAVTVSTTGGTSSPVQFTYK